jgi:hypothetical protein
MTAKTILTRYILGSFHIIPTVNQRIAVVRPKNLLRGTISKLVHMTNDSPVTNAIHFK